MKPRKTFLGRVSVAHFTTRFYSRLSSRPPTAVFCLVSTVYFPAAGPATTKASSLPNCPTACLTTYLLDAVSRKLKLDIACPVFSLTVPFFPLRESWLLTFKPKPLMHVSTSSSFQFFLWQLRLRDLCEEKSAANCMFISK